MILSLLPFGFCLRRVWFSSSQTLPQTLESSAVPPPKVYSYHFRVFSSRTLHKNVDYTYQERARRLIYQNIKMVEQLQVAIAFANFVRPEFLLPFVLPKTPRISNHLYFSVNIFIQPRNNFQVSTLQGGGEREREKNTS